MTKKEYCETHPVCGTWADSAFSGIEIHGIENEDYDDYVYYVRVLSSKKTYHKSKIRYYDDRPYFSWFAQDIFLDEVSKV